MGFLQVLLYIAALVIVFIVKSKKRNELNDKKKHLINNTKTENLTFADTEKLINDMKAEFLHKKKSTTVSNVSNKSDFLIKDSINKEVIDYDKIATDPNIDLIPDTPIVFDTNNKHEQNFFEQYFGDEFDIRKAIIYSEIINRKY